MDTRRMLGLGALYLGTSMTAGCWYSLRRAQRWLATSVVAEGQVIGVQKGILDTDDNRETYLPAIAFHTSDGQRVTFTSTTGASPQAYRVGQSVAIRYQPSRPHDARLNELGTPWLAPIVTGSIGFWALLAGLVLTFTHFD